MLSLKVCEMSALVRNMLQVRHGSDRDKSKKCDEIKKKKNK